MAKSLNNGQKELQNVESPQGNGNSNLEQLELPNMPKAEKTEQYDAITIKFMKVGNKQFYAIDVESKNPEVYVVSQKLWALLQKLAKNNVSINLKID